MSTRSQIEFVDESGKVLIYRHSDGYPTSLVSDLIEFLKWGSDRIGDLEYLTANYIFYEKFQTLDYFAKQDPKREDKYLDDRYAQLGYGICQPEELHGDIEWFYRVIMNRSKLEIEIHKTEFDLKYKDIGTKTLCHTLKIDDIHKFEVDQELLGKIEEGDIVQLAS